MKNRTIVTLVIAAILACLVMGVAVIMTFAGWVGTQKFDSNEAWGYDFSGTQSMKIIDMNGDGQDDLFVQNLSSVLVLDSQGNSLLEQAFPEPLITTLGDVNGDNVEDIIAFTSGKVTLLSLGKPVQEFAVPGLGTPARAVLLHFAGGAQVILGDEQGGLASLALDGSLRWAGQLSSGDIIRGLDDARVGGQAFLAAANHNGAVALFDEAGTARWQYAMPGTVRRLRSYDLNGDGTSELLLGGDDGVFIMLNAASGEPMATYPTSQAITEIREVEIDGEPSSREFVFGGKEGGVWAMKADASLLWNALLRDKVTEIAGLDVDGDGVQEVVVGDDVGTVALFSGPDGERTSLPDRSSSVGRIDAGKLGAKPQVVVADASSLSVYDLQAQSLPQLRYTPLIFGLVAVLIIMGVAWVIASLPARPVEKVAIDDQSPEGLQAQRRMLKESIADVERLRSAGEVTSDAYLLRLKDLRGQLADNEAALKKAGIPFVVETYKCPHCGGTIPLGADRCDYCKQTVIV